jgi:hypothetical protein
VLTLGRDSLWRTVNPDYRLCERGEQQQVALDDGLGHIDEPSPCVLGVGAKHLERPLLIYRVARHENPFRLLDYGSPAERSLKALELREPLERDVDCALELLGSGIDDVGEDTALGCLVNVGVVRRREQRDHRTGRLVDDLRDQLEGVLRADPEPDEGHVGLFPGGDGANLSDVDLPGNHLVTEARHDLGEQSEPVPPLVRDQDAEVDGLLAGH